MRIKPTLLTCVLAICLHALPSLHAHAAEILQEEGPTRVVTGDWAVWTTRGIAEEPVPYRVPQLLISAALDRCKADDALPYAKAIRAGIARYGWAQFEQEPIGGSGTKVQALVVSKKAPVFHVRVFGDPDLVASASANLPDGPLQAMTFAVPERLDRTVYRSFVSTEQFVLYQEHFHKHFHESVLNLDLQGLQKVKEAHESGKAALAVYETAEYFRRKTEPAKLLRKLATPGKVTTHPKAEEICKHIFRYGDETVEMGDRMEWRKNPTNNAELIWGLNRHSIWVDLLEGYIKTGNEKYSREFCTQVVDWIVENPAPPYSLTRVATWRNLEAGYRCAHTWPQTFYGFLSSPNFTPQAIQLMLASLWSHGEYIMKFPAGLRTPNNWSIIDSTGLAALAMYFPDLRGSDEWLKTGFDRLEHQLRLQVYPDGAQYELTTGYHTACLRSFDTICQLARDTGTDLSAGFRDGLESMYEYLMWVAKPNGYVPTVNDTSPFSIRPLLEEGAERFSRDDMLYVATNGEHGTPPERTSRALPYAGQLVMRSGWDNDALYLFFDAGPYGVSHQHEDKLNIDVSAFGRDLLSDPGRYRYVPDKWRAYMLSTAAHSTVMVDGLSQSRLDLKETYTAPADLKHGTFPTGISWHSEAGFDYARGQYTEGYGPDHVPVTHERHIFLKKPEYWVVVDYVTGDGQHTVESLFHFVPSPVELGPEQLTAVTDNPNEPNLLIAAAPQEGLSASLVEGQEDPVQGWSALSPGKPQPSPVLIYRFQRPLPVTLAYVLLPYQGSRRPAVSISQQHDTGEVKLTVRPEKALEDVLVLRLDTDIRSSTLGIPPGKIGTFTRTKNGNVTESCTWAAQD